MKNVMSLCLSILLLSLCLLWPTRPAIGRITQITDNSGADHTPHVGGGLIVWEGWDGNDSEIFAFDGTTTKQITDNEVDDQEPKTDGTCIVWRVMDPDNDLYFYNGTSITRLTDNDYADYPYDIDQGQVVWQGDESPDREIFLFDGQSVRNFTDNTEDDREPLIDNGMVAWRQLAGTVSEPGFELYLSDGVNTVNPSAATLSAIMHHMNNGQIVWVSGGDIYYYDHNGTQQITDTVGTDSSPQVEDGRIVWQHPQPFDNTLVLLYDESGIAVLSDAAIHSFEPKISGGYVVWRGNVGSENELFLYDGTTTTQLTHDSENLFGLVIDDGNVVWSAWDGSDYEIYLYDCNDRDADGLDNDLEIIYGTDPDDADTDDDGILDGMEDANQNGALDTGETSPLLVDTDGDGIQDGTESGLTTGDPDTDLAVFIPDADPTTTTDPTLADTDGDGVSDGDEDLNKNGRVDAGEEDPNDRNVKALPGVPLLLLEN